MEVEAYRYGGGPSREQLTGPRGPARRQQQQQPELLGRPGRVQEWHYHQHRHHDPYQQQQHHHQQQWAVGAAAVAIQAHRPMVRKRPGGTARDGGIIHDEHYNRLHQRPKLSSTVPPQQLPLPPSGLPEFPPPPTRTEFPLPPPPPARLTPVYPPPPPPMSAQFPLPPPPSSDKVPASVGGPFPPPPPLHKQQQQKQMQQRATWNSDEDGCLRQDRDRRQCGDERPRGRRSGEGHDGGERGGGVEMHRSRGNHRGRAPDGRSWREPRREQQQQEGRPGHVVSPGGGRAALRACFK